MRGQSHARDIPRMTDRPLSQLASGGRKAPIIVWMTGFVCFALLSLFHNTWIPRLIMLLITQNHRNYSCITYRHPETSQRPDFLEVARELSLPDTRLLKWSEEDKCVHPEAAKLGADLLCGESLYKDLQTCYKWRRKYVVVCIFIMLVAFYKVAWGGGCLAVL